MFTLKTSHGASELKGAFDQDFDTDKPTDHIHGAILALCNPGFDKPRTRATLTDLVIDLSVLQSKYSNIELFLRNAFADGEISFRPDTPIHANDEQRYQGGRIRDRIDQTPRHFEFGAVGGGMRVVYDIEIDEIYISAHYSYPARLVAKAGSVQGDWLLTTKARLDLECWSMIEHASGASLRQSKEAERLEDLTAQAEALKLQTAKDSARRSSQLRGSLLGRAQRNRAFNAWLNDPQSGMTSGLRQQIYGLPQ